MGRFDVFLKATWVETLSTALTAVRSFKPKGMSDLKSAVLKIDLLFGSLVEIWKNSGVLRICSLGVESGSSQMYLAYI